MHICIDLTLADGSEFMGERLTVQFARGSRQRNDFTTADRSAPRPRRTPHRMQISGLPGETSWQVCVSRFRSFIRIFGSCNLEVEPLHFGAICYK